MNSIDGRTFAAMIITHGRPDSVETWDTLRRSGYTGRIVIVIDNLDKTADRYREKFGAENVAVFDKREYMRRFDMYDNFRDVRQACSARNACFDIAEQLGIQDFVELDDDYFWFHFRRDADLNYKYETVRCLDEVFAAFVRFLRSTPVASIAMAQGGDYIGGKRGRNAGPELSMTRKCMNSWFCSTDRRIHFHGTMNDDVNTYVLFTTRGRLFFTNVQCCLLQPQTQAIAGGMTDVYKDSGTYRKTFYTVMIAPSCSKVSALRDRTQPRIHHHISWENCAPKVLSESVKGYGSEGVEDKEAASTPPV